MRDRTTLVNPPPYTDGWERPVGVREDGTTLLLDVWLVSRSTHGLLDEALAPAGLTADEFAVYSMLRGSEEGSTPSELAGWMAAPPTTVSSYVKRFEGRGHVERVPNPDDRRSYRLRLTDETVYLRNAAINLVNGMINLTFSCDGTHYIDHKTFFAELDNFETNG